METTLRPLSTGELLDRTLTLFRRHFWLFVGLMILPQIFMLAGTVTVSSGPSLVALGLPAPSAIGLSVVGGLMLIVGVFLTFMAQAAAITATSEIQVGRSITIRDSYRRVRGKFWALFWATILYFLAVFGGFILLIVPGVWVLLRGTLIYQVITIEDVRGVEALRRSIALTKGAVGPIFLLFLFLIFVYFLAAAVFQLPAMTLLPEPWSLTLGQVGEVLATALAQPISSIAFALLYFDQRVRKEAFDLEVMMNALDQPAPPPAGDMPPAIS
jgi:hypothetical protein